METDFYKKWACQKFIESSQSNVWDGHWACAVLALTNLLEEKLVPDSMQALMKKNLDKTLEEHANDQKYRIKKEYVGITDSMIELLSQNQRSCHALGHDVIYTFYLIHMLSRSNIPATAELFDAMKKIVKDFSASGPGYVTVHGKNMVIDPDAIPDAGIKLHLNSETVLDFLHNFQRPLHQEQRDMQLGHILTHGHAIVELKQISSNYVLDNLDSSFNKRINILTYANKLEEKVIGSDIALSDIALNPWESAYWEQALVDSRHGHYYKYAYSYLKLSRMAGHTLPNFRSFRRVL
ncbi:hypothetical protein WMW72_02315 [Paenibacillus filicis]|uniref:Uncharacterized protein n=1 Tax=Paenibacillus filicis TaxID=669464 RepID=A0ABU9DD19_9BACL